MSSTYRKKMIEVALPLEAINKASAREKSIRHGHPSTLHLWWARRPLAACRAVLFSSLVNDPDDDPMYGHDQDVAATERAKLFSLIEELVLWENSNNPEVINRARLEIARSIAANKVADGELSDDTQLVSTAPELPEEQAKYLPDPPPEYTPHDVRFKMPGLKPEQVNHFLAHYAPPVLDPFAGGGSIPLEAQRLGLRAYASDLNPVPVLINKALIEIPPKFAGQPPVNPESEKGKLKTRVWKGAEGLAEDVRYYGKWMRDEAEKRIGHLYSKVKVTQQMADDGRPDLEPYVGKELTVIAWLWARTVKSPNPAAKGAHVPLIRSFWLSKKKGKEVYIRPKVNHDMTISYEVRRGLPNDFNPDEGTVDRNGGRCLVTDVAIPFNFIREEGRTNNIGHQLIGVVAKGIRKRLYFSPSAVEATENDFQEVDWLNTQLPEKALGFRVQNYGITGHAQLFSPRQLYTLSRLADIVKETRDVVRNEATDEYANAIVTYLALAVDRIAMTCNSLARWNPVGEKVQHAFGRQTLSMIWDYPEANIFGSTTGSLQAAVDLVADPLEQFVSGPLAIVRQQPAQKHDVGEATVYSTDPPYYDNVPYADLSDFFYVWLRKMLAAIYPSLFATMLVPKSEELVADPFRHGGKKESKNFFENGIESVFSVAQRNALANVPATIYYAFKQAESSGSSLASTGWETMLAGLVQAGWEINGTWPIRTEMPSRLRSMASNALASSVVLVCRPRSPDAVTLTRRDFSSALRKELPSAIKDLQLGNIAPVDLSQASIGPGMAVFSRYAKVVNSDGSALSVREALHLINQILDETISEQEVEFDSETRFALAWYDQFGMKEGPFGEAQILATAKAVSVEGVGEAGVLIAKAGKVRLLGRDEMPVDWSPATDRRLTMWETTQHLIRRLENEGESSAASLVYELMELRGGEHVEAIRDLCYRLYQTSDRKKRAEDAMSFNGLVVSWPEILKLALKRKSSIQPTNSQADLFS